MATHSSTLAWQIPWTEEPGRLQSMGLLGVGHDWATSLTFFTFMHWRRKWQPTPVLLPGESQGRGSLVGCRLWGRTESDTTDATLQLQQHGISVHEHPLENVSILPVPPKRSPADIFRGRRKSSLGNACTKDTWRMWPYLHEPSEMSCLYVSPGKSDILPFKIFCLLIWKP